MKKLQIYYIILCIESYYWRLVLNSSPTAAAGKALACGAGMGGGGRSQMA